MLFARGIRETKKDIKTLFTFLKLLWINRKTDHSISSNTTITIMHINYVY